MKAVSQLLLAMFSVVLICSCSATKWSYEKEAINLHLSSDVALNKYNNRPHSLIVCAYQLKDVNAFNQLIDEKGGLERLLECNRFDSSVMYSKSLVVQPSQGLIISQSRTEDTKYLGIVAGYYASLKKENAVRIYRIPVSWLNNPKKLYIELHMGPEGIQEIKEKHSGEIR